MGREGSGRSRSVPGEFHRGEDVLELLQISKDSDRQQHDLASLINAIPRWSVWRFIPVYEGNLIFLQLSSYYPYMAQIVGRSHPSVLRTFYVIERGLHTPGTHLLVS